MTRIDGSFSHFPAVARRQHEEERGGTQDKNGGEKSR